MDNMPQLPSTADLEMRAAKIADPGIDLKTKHTVACEIREMLDTVRDTESAGVLPQMIPALMELLRSGEPAFHKDTVEYPFRRVLLDILHRIPYNVEAVRTQANTLFNCMLFLLRHDNEENGVTACKAIVDLVRHHRSLTEELVSDFMDIFQQVFHNIRGLVDEVLSEDSALLDLNVILPSVRSFKVLAEMGMVVVIFSQSHRPLVSPTIQATLPSALEVLAVESPAQKRAREDYEGMGGFWAGMAPTIRNAQAYTDFITAEIKMVSYLAYIMRWTGDQDISYGETLILAALRILQDCPANAVVPRKDLMVVFRHLLATPHRRALLSQLDKLFDERVLLGSGITSKELLRAHVYSAVADLVHHVKNDLSSSQIARIVHVYSRLIHNPSLSSALHTMFAKMMLNLTDTILTKETASAAARILGAMFQTCVDRLETLTVVQQEVFASMAKIKSGNRDESNAATIERARPIGGAAYAVEKPEEVIYESRVMYRALLHGFRACLGGLRKCADGRPVDLDGSLVFRLFEGCINCMSLFDADPRVNESNEAVEWFGAVLLEINLHVFQEVWTHKIEFFFQCAQKRIVLLNICQYLFNRESCSPTLLAIVLKFLVDRLPLLGEHDDLTTAATIRLFKMAFGAVATHPTTNEPILASYLARLLMDCFPLSVKATKPSNYLHLLRALFRSIGGGGGRFELLYKEVLPLLPDMLESLNRQLLASEDQTRDMIVELCLTVPLRLTHLLPHLTYLMQPLALALRGNPELVSQGLRTLELCIDNLTPDFLDPTLNLVLRDLMEALHSHLKPLPANHHPAHTTIRILGKLGGRNRRLLSRQPALQYRPHSEPAKMTISFGGNLEQIDLGPMSILAARTLKRTTTPDRVHAYNYLENCLTILLHEGINTRNIEVTFVRSLEGIFDSIHLTEIKEQAISFVRKLSRTVFDMEIRRNQTRDIGSHPSPSPLLSSYLDALPHALAHEQTERAKAAQALLSLIIQDLVAMGNQAGVTAQDIVPTLHQIASRFSALCLDDSWVRKSAGCSGIKIMTCTPNLGVKWITDREMDLVRTLLHILKDLPLDLPRDIDDVVDVLVRVLRVSNSDVDGRLGPMMNLKNKFVHLAGIFFPELQSSNPVVRQAAQTCISLLVELSGMPVVELLTPHRERLLAGIYTKPLRALPFSIQIGMLEAIRYCVSLDPPLVELNDELLRLLHETLALADADDVSLLGRGNPRQGSIEVVKLRVACIKLLTASMPLTDFFSRQHQTRKRVTSVYFKSLYSPSPEIKDAAHEGLRMVLTHQSRLPKELLQTGLRPILMNLADPKRLSVPGLEGLARLLELLTNYFKVEIGHKLLDHFRIVADPQMLQASSRLPLSDNEGITKLVRLANIFHLLPSAANMFLENLVNAIVQTEAQMCFSSQSPFSEPLAKYLDRYPAEGAEYFLRHLNYPRYLRTLRSIIQAKLAPHLERELASRTPIVVSQYLEGNDSSFVIPALLLLSDMAEYIPSWITENGYAIDALVLLWRSEQAQPEKTAVIIPDVIQRHTIILTIFMKALEQSPRIDLIFDIVSFFTRNLAMGHIRISRFLYEHIALSNDLSFRRNILMRFLTWFDNPSYSWPHKAYFIRYIVTPILLIHASRSPRKYDLLNVDFVDRIHRTIWHPVTGNISFSETDDMFKIELLHLTTVMVHHYPELLEDVKKDIIKCAWHYITASDDAIVKQTAYLLTARFFAAFPTPQKFIIRTWTGLLRPPHSEGRSLIRQEALATLAPSLPPSDSAEGGYPQWAKTARRLLADEGGLPQLVIIYQLIVKQPQLFFPVRALFVPHMVNSLSKLGLNSSSTNELRLLSIDMLQVLFDWEQKAVSSISVDSGQKSTTWLTPVGFRENMVSYLVRLATAPHEQPARLTLVPRALALLQSMVAPTGWSDVTVGLRFFLKALEGSDLNTEAHLTQAIASAKVIQVIAADQTDSWYSTNANILQKLVRKGMVTDEHALHDALHPIFERLVRLFPLPKEDDEQEIGEIGEFHSFIHTAIADGLRNTTVLRGTLLMLKSVVQVVPERIEPFSLSLMKLLSKLAKEHLQSTPTSPGFENMVRLLLTILDIYHISVAYLGDQRKYFLSTMVHLLTGSKSLHLCRYMLDLARGWALHKQDAYPTMKETASLLQKMVAFEMRGEALFHPYLELIFEIYTEPTYRRSDLTLRLEHSFLLGCRARDPTLRERFMDLYDLSIPRSLLSRLTYILGVQSWEALADQSWIYLALHLLLGAVDFELPMVTERRVSFQFGIQSTSHGKAQNIIRPMQRLLFLDPQTAHDTWISVFPAAWACLSRREQADITVHMITLLSKDYHVKQAEIRPNVIQTLLTGIHACSPPMTLPPHLVKYLAKTYGAWYVGLEILGASLEYVRDDDITVRDYVYDSLADVYAELAEDDLFYGLWRRRCLHQETNVAIAFEQNGMWEQASLSYEIAQSKSRAGSIPFSEPEYCLWEDHWMLSAEKLQQWDTLYELAKNEGNQELMLESAWRTKDWAENRESLEEQINQLPEVPTPRRRVFEAFIALLKLPGALDKNVEFTKLLEDAMQLSLRKWVGLPPHLSAAHLPLLQHFQQFVELQEAVSIFGSLSVTNAGNLEKKSQELKMVLQAWRERLPNLHDDISIWSDLVAWRQNVFNAINKAYIPLISGTTQSAGTNAASTNTHGYRGYHETAWIINRFAHVARKHDLLDACFTSLNRIYTLPNIEISEAFLKLREQARCYYQKPNDLQAGLEVINNTNLMYFSTSQKAEFYTLKGMFHARFGRNEEANQAFGQAVQLDMTQAKAWAEWGRFNDRMFKENPMDMSHAANAVSCYLQAAGQYKNGKSRPLLTRILWLLSVDDGTFTISRAFDTYKGDAAFWYWISLIPQLCLSISHREVKQARYILLNLAKLYPQALFFQVRTTRDEIMTAKKAAAARAMNAGQPQATGILVPTGRPSADQPMRDAMEVDKKNEAAGLSQTLTSSHVTSDQGHIPTPAASTVPSIMPNAPPAETSSGRQAWEYVEEVVQILKTASPLLTLSMETMVDQLNNKFKPNTDEEMYRHICLLLQDGMQSFVVRMNVSDDDGQLSQAIKHTIRRIASSMSGHTRVEFDEDFVNSEPVLQEYLQRLQRWRDKYEKLLDSRPRIQPLDVLSHYLLEFQYSKVDEIEVPGQYTEDKDSNQNFIRIQKFAPKFENYRSYGSAWKRITLYGNDNSKTSFTVQLPSHRYTRREEKVMQVLRTFNGALSRKKESRKRNLNFHLPAAISCSHTLRLFQTDSSYVSLGDIYETYCEEADIAREEPILMAGEKIKKVLREFRQSFQKQPNKTEYLTLKKEIFDEITVKLVPDNILTRYMIRTMDGPSELWRMRKQFALHIAATSFMTYFFCLSSRYPSRFHLSRATGEVAMVDLQPALSNQAPVFATSDVVPFRFTPNMQHFLGPIFTEGILTSGILAIGRCVTEPEFDLEQQLCLFARDEVTTWMTGKTQPWTVNLAYRNSVAAMIDGLVKRAEAMSCKNEREQAIQNTANAGSVPVVQTVTNLISSATNPIQLTKMSELYHPWF